MMKQWSNTCIYVFGWHLLMKYDKWGNFFWNIEKKKSYHEKSTIFHTNPYYILILLYDSQHAFKKKIIFQKKFIKKKSVILTNNQERKITNFFDTNIYYDDMWYQNNLIYQVSNVNFRIIEISSEKIKLFLICASHQIL